jgi:hypothetical protein
VEHQCVPDGRRRDRTRLRTHRDGVAAQERAISRRPRPGSESAKARALRSPPGQRESARRGSAAGRFWCGHRRVPSRSRSPSTAPYPSPLALPGGKRWRPGRTPG